MNSRVAVVLFIVVGTAVLFQKSDAFTAGAGNIKKRVVTEVTNLSLLAFTYLCVKSTKSS